jgi:GH35 family endo-1,4-beta-xylanase
VIEALKSAGLTIYGHTLVWHNQQKTSYWNSLIAPQIIPGAPGESALENGSFEEGMDDWGSWGSKTSVEISTEEHIDGNQSLKIGVSGNASAVYSMQLQTPSVPLVVGHHYRISFYIKSDNPGAVRISFDDGLNPKPFGNSWPGNTASDGIENTISTSSVWKQIIYDREHSSCEFLAAANSVNIRFDLGLFPNVIYYLDLVEVVDLDAEPAEPTYVNMVSHGTFDEYESIDALNADWNSWGASSSRELSADGDGYNGTGKCLIIHSIGATVDYGVQATTNLTEAFTVGNEYHMEAMIKSSVTNGKVRVQFQGGNASYLPSDAVGTSWMKIEHDFTAANANNKLFFDLGEVEGDYYIDNVVVYDKATASLAPLKASKKSNVLKAGPVIIEKTPEEKKAILEPLFTKYVNDVTKHYAGKVAAWDVLNEALNENGTIRGENEEPASNSHFYWAYYLGKDYAVTAFKTAREADLNAKLFINDYNLESASGNKLDGLLEYVQYIEQNGGKIDGIGTQMHLNVNWIDTTSIKTMFQKLAATGKLIKISELDIAISSSSNPESPVQPTAEQYERQAELYRFVANAYNQYIPEAQRYGITVWSVSDNEKEHEYWLKNDAPCLWDADYARKHAYKGFADGLAGRDVSADFSGELITNKN